MVLLELDFRGSQLRDVALVDLFEVGDLLLVEGELGSGGSVGVGGSLDQGGGPAETRVVGEEVLLLDDGLSLIVEGLFQFLVEEVVGRFVGLFGFKFGRKVVVLNLHIR